MANKVEGYSLMYMDIDVGAPKIIMPAGGHSTGRIEIEPEQIKAKI